MKNISGRKNLRKLSPVHLTVMMVIAVGAVSIPASLAFANPPLPLGTATPGQPIPRIVVTAKRMTVEQKAEYDAELRTKRAQEQKTSRSKEKQG